MFVDRIHFLIQAGDGGNGCESFYRRTDRKLVPHGGDGGDGGKVIFRVDPNAPGLESFRMRQYMIAESGGHGGSTKKRGRNGQELIILVRPGTRVMDRARNLVIRELLRVGEEMVVLEGGRGGSGNQGGKEATPGEKGTSMDIELSNRIGADIFFVGLPNSGKSKLLNTLTRTHVKEETYPFSTKEPQIGVFPVSDYESLTLCELPSLYETSHEGRGLGNEFLKHLERAKYIFYILDPGSKFAPSLKEGLAILKKQVENSQKDFAAIPSAAVVTQMDLLEKKEIAEKEKKGLKAPVFYISALSGEGMEKLKTFMKEKEEGWKLKVEHA